MKPVYYQGLYAMLIVLDVLLAAHAFQNGNTAGGSIFALGIFVWAALLFSRRRSRR